MLFARRFSRSVNGRKVASRRFISFRPSRRRGWVPVVAIERLEPRQLLSATVGGAAAGGAATTQSGSSDPPAAPTITLPAPENNMQRGPMGFTIDSNGNVTMIGPGTGNVLGAVNGSGFLNVTGVTLGADGISGTFNFTGQIVISGGQASLQSGTYTATYNWGGFAWQTQVGNSPPNQPPVATGQGTWNVPSFTLTNPTASGVAKYAGTYMGSYIGTINTVVFSTSSFANDPITLADPNTNSSANDTLLIQSNNADATIYVAPGTGEGGSNTTPVSGDGTSSVTVTGTLAQLQAAVNGLVYVPPSLKSPSPYHVSDLLNFTLTDGGSSEQATASEPVTSFQTPTISFTPPPANVTPTPSISSVTVSNTGTLVFDSDATGTGAGHGPAIVVGDNANATDQLTLSVSHGTLALAPGTLLPGYTGPASTITVTGTPAQLNAALADGNTFLQYSPNAGYVGPDTLQISLANDLGDGLVNIPYGQQVTTSIGINVT